MTKDLITLYGDQQIHVLWTLIVVQFIIILFLIFRNQKKIVDDPIGFRIKLLSEINNMLVYSLTVGPVVDNDVVERRLTIEVNGALIETKTFPSSATDLGEVIFEEGVNVNLALVDIDDAGNVSEPAFIRFTTTDTIPPAPPGGFGAVLVAEKVPTTTPKPEAVVEVPPDPVDIDVPLPEPEPAPEVTPEPTPEEDKPLSE